MDDPVVPKRLEDAITMVGTCMDMCPRFERYTREHGNQVDPLEAVRTLHSVLRRTLMGHRYPGATSVRS
jgi:hypothetical protein